MLNLDTLRSILENIKSDQVVFQDPLNLSRLFKDPLSYLEPSAILENYQLWVQDTIWLFQASEAVSRCLEEEQVAQVIVEQMASLLQLDSCLLFSWDRVDSSLVLWKEHGLSTGEINALQDLPVRLPDIPVIRQALENQHGMIAAVSETQPQVPLKTLFLLPLVFQKEVYGLVIAVSDEQEGGSVFQRLLLGQFLAQHAAAVIHQMRLVEAAQKRVAALEAIHRVGLSLTVSLDLQMVLDAVLNNALTLQEGARYAHIFLYKEDALEFGAAGWAGESRSGPAADLKPNELAYHAARLGEIILRSEKTRFPFRSNNPFEQSGIIASLPLKVGERVVGVMVISHPDPQAFSDENLRLFQDFIDQAAIAIENARLYGQVSQQALTDALTGLPNRRALDEHLEEEMRRSSRYQHPFTLMMLDINGFKQINDIYGHPVGDSVLKQVAACLRSRLRDTDFLARYGGDEFAIVLPETDLSVAQGMASRLSTDIFNCSIELPDSTQGAGDRQVRISLGMAMFPSHAISTAALVVAADQALYRAKSAYPSSR